MTNEERLALHPDGSCPECGSRSWAGYLRPEEKKTGTYCLTCYAHFPEDENPEIEYCD